MGCNSCIFLDISDKKEGANSGAVYYCKKHNKYVNAAATTCDDHEKDYTRKTYEMNEAYLDGVNYSDITTPVQIQVIFIILLIAVLFIISLLTHTFPI